MPAPVLGRAESGATAAHLRRGQTREKKYKKKEETPWRTCSANISRRYRISLIADLLAQYRRRDPDKVAIVDLDQGTSISFGALDRAVTDIASALRERGVGKGSPRAASFRRDPRKAVDLARNLAARRGRGAAQYRAQCALIADLARHGLPRACAGAQASWTAMRCWRAGRSSASANTARTRPTPIRRTISFARCRAAMAADSSARAQRSRRHSLHLLHVGHDQPAQGRRLRPLRLLAQRAVDPGMPRTDRRRPHAGIPLVRLEFGAGAQPDAVPRNRSHIAYGQAVFAQPILRLDPATTASPSPPACRRCSTCC